MKCCKILRSPDRVFVFEFVKCLCTGAPSKDPARFVDLGFWIFEKQVAEEYKRVPKKHTTTEVSSKAHGTQCGIPSFTLLPLVPCSPGLRMILVNNRRHWLSLISSSLLDASRFVVTALHDKLHRPVGASATCRQGAADAGSERKTQWQKTREATCSGNERGGASGAKEARDGEQASSATLQQAVLRSSPQVWDPLSHAEAQLPSRGQTRFLSRWRKLLKTSFCQSVHRKRVTFVHHSSCRVAFRCWCVALYQTASHAARHSLRVLQSTPRPFCIKLFMYFTTAASSLPSVFVIGPVLAEADAPVLLAFAVPSSTLLPSAVCLCGASSANGCSPVHKLHGRCFFLRRPVPPTACLSFIGNGNPISSPRRFAAFCSWFFGLQLPDSAQCRRWPFNRNGSICIKH